MLIKRYISSILVIVLTVCGMTFVSSAGQDLSQMTERILVTYEDQNITQEFGAPSSGLGASYVSPDSMIRVVGNSEAVMGSRSLAVNRCDMRWWTIGARDTEMYVSIVVKVNENFNNEMILSMASSKPSGYSGPSDGVIITVTKQDGIPVIKDSSGKTVAELENDVRYNIRTAFRRGENEYDIFVNNLPAAEGCKFRSEVYSVESVSVNVNELAKDSGDTAAASAAEEHVAYILIDNPCVATKGRAYPQKYSTQAPGAMPYVDVPDEPAESGDIKVFINSTQIAMTYAPVLRDGTVYTDLEQIARCINMDFTEDNSDKTFRIKNADTDIAGTVDSDEITVNGKKCVLTAPVRKINGIVNVPPNFLNEALNAKVWWDEYYNMLVITTGSRKKDGILRSVGGRLYMNGEPYYEISFNKFDMFYQILSEYVPDGQFPSEEYTVSAAEAALKQLNELGFKSIRVFVYSNALPDLMYNEESQKTYFKAMDQFFDLCDKYDIKVVVCLGLIESYLLKNEYIEGKGWITGTETTTDIVADRDSESRQNVYKYLDMFISRYKDRKSVLMWEIKNEGSLDADVGEAVRNVHYSLLQLAGFYGDCADKIRSIDSEHLITSGDSVLRNSQWNLLNDVMNGSGLSWKTDTAEERLKALSLLNSKLDVISAHAYGLGVSDVSVYTDSSGNTVNCDFEMYEKEAARLGKPFYNGETNGSYQLESKTFYEDTQAYIDSIINARVQLSHWWTFRSDRQGFNDGYLWRIDSGELLDMITDANRRIKEVNAVNRAEADNTSDVWDDPSYDVFDPGAVTDGSAFVARTSFRSKMIRLIVICAAAVIAAGVGVFILTREKLRKKRKKDIV